MQFFPSTLSKTESNAFVDRISEHFEQHDFGLWAVELSTSDEFVGYVGLSPATFEAHFTPAVEIGWRLARRFWGSGLAPEAAQAAVADGFDRLDVNEIVSFTAEINLRSRRVMEKLEMTHDPGEDFEHPSVPIDHPLRPHVLYRTSKKRHGPA